MSIFLRLLLAHLIGDFLLQTDKVFKIKVKYKWGVLLHGGIVTIVSALFIIPYLHHLQVISFLILLSIVHILQDKAKIIFNEQIERNNLWTFLLDQVSHVLVIFFVSLGTTNLSRMKYPGPAVLQEIYLNDHYVVFAIWFIVLTYGISIIQEYIKKIIIKDRKENIIFPRSYQKYLEILERALIGVFIFLGGTWYLFAIVTALVGLFFVYKGKSPKVNFRVSIISALIIGLLMRITV